MPHVEGHSLVVDIHNTIYRFGGKYTPGDKYTNEVWALQFAPPKAVWDRAPVTGTIPSPRAYHGAVLWRNRYMVVIGGVGGLEKERAEGRDEEIFYLWDLRTREWTSQRAMGDLPRRRCHHTLAMSPNQDCIYLYGGYPLGTGIDTHFAPESPQAREFFDVHELLLHSAQPTWRRVSFPGTPPMLWGHSIALYLNNLIVFGGVDVVDSSESNTVCVWHCERHQWRWVEFVKSPPQRALHTALAVDGEMIVFGGFGNINTTKFNDVWSFGLDAGQWTEVHTKATSGVPSPRCGHASVVIDGSTLVVHGGVTAPTSSPPTPPPVYLLNLSSRTWTELTSVERGQAESHRSALVDTPDPASSTNPRTPVNLPTTPPPPSDHTTPSRPSEVVWVQLNKPSTHFDEHRFKNVMSQYLATPIEAIEIMNVSKGLAVIRLRFHGPNAEPLAKELLRRCVNPADPIRSELGGVIKAGWDSGDDPLPHQRADTVPKPIDEIVPFTDDKRYVQPVAKHRTPTPPPHPAEPAPPPVPPKHGLSQAVQTARLEEPPQRAAHDPEAQAVIARQREQIEELESRLRMLERADKAARDGFLQLPEYYNIDRPPKLSNSTPEGPPVTLTKSTLADLLPLSGVLKAAATAGLGEVKVSPAASAHITRSATAAAVESRAVGPAEYVPTPELLPTHKVDPTFPSAVHFGHAPTTPYTGVGPTALPHPTPWGTLAKYGVQPTPRERPPASAAAPLSAPKTPPAKSPRGQRTKSPSLRSIISGNASMLSITHIPGAP